MFLHTTERAETAVDQVGRTVRKMTYFLSSRAMSRRLSYFPREKSTSKRLGLSFLWKIWICSGSKRERLMTNLRLMYWKKHGLKVSSLLSPRSSGSAVWMLAKTIIYRRKKMLKCHSVRRKRKRRLQRH